MVSNYYIKQAASYYFPSSLGPLVLKASLARRQTPFSFPWPCQRLRHSTSRPHCPPSPGHSTFKLWGKEGVPAVALWVVTSRPATRSISSVKEKSANECNRKEGMGVGEAWARMETGRRSWLREQTGRKRHGRGWQWRTGTGWHILK